MGRSFIRKLICISTLLISVVGYMFDYNISWFYIAISVLISFLFFFNEDDFALKDIRIRPIHLFIISYLIVFFQKPLDYLLGYPMPRVDMGRLDLVPQCLSLATIGLSSLLLGYNYKKRYVALEHYFFSTTTYAGSVKVFSALVSIFIILILVVVPKSVLLGGYGTGFSSGGESINYLLSWGSVFISAFFIQHTFNLKSNHLVIDSFWDYIKSVGAWQNINILAYFLIILNIGDRGPMIVILIAYYLSFIMIAKRSPSIVFMLSSLIIAAVFFSLLGYSKHYRDNNDILERLSVTISESENKNEPKTSILEQTEELAFSYNCLAYSIENVPEHYDYKYGMYQVSYILKTIPFVSRFIKLPENSSATVTYFIQGPYAIYGNGTSCLADFYLDLGLIGVIIGMFLWGYFLRFFECSLISNEISSVTLQSIAFYFCIYVFYIPRACVLFYLKYAIYLAIIMTIYQNINKKRIK